MFWPPAVNLKRTRCELAPIAAFSGRHGVATSGARCNPELSLVPLESHLEIEAMIQNKDIGFVSACQQAQIKIDAFNFDRYGLIDGRVVSISSDAIVRDKPPDKNNANQRDSSQEETSEPANQELAYAARVSLAHTQMEIEEKLVNLSRGMAVTVEIKTGSRRIISYLHRRSCDTSRRR
jgi:hemolysin D